MAVSAKSRDRQIRAQISQLRADRKAWLRGDYSPWGMPWCAGPASPYHQPPACEGCAGNLWLQGKVVPISEEIRHLEGLLEPVVQIALF